MAIPDRPLDLNLDSDTLQDMTLEDVAIFDSDTAASRPFVWINQVRRFLVKYSTTWTAAEINAITIAEMEGVAKQLTEAINSVAVPLAPEPPSKTGDG